MQYRTLESEVKSLDAELTRLRIMVNRCVEAQDAHRDEQLRSSNAQKNEKADVYDPTPNNLLHRRESVGGTLRIKLPLPNDPMSVLPSIFSGMEGTARLFKVMIETYPWLVPPELLEAQSLLHERRSAEKNTRRLKRQLRKSVRKVKKLKNKIRDGRKGENNDLSDTEASDSSYMSPEFGSDEERSGNVSPRHQQKALEESGRPPRVAQQRQQQRIRSEIEDHVVDQQDARHTTQFSSSKSIEQGQKVVEVPFKESSEKKAIEGRQAIGDDVKEDLPQPISSVPISSGVLGHRTFSQKPQKLKIAMLGRDSDEEEAEVALANTRRSTVATIGSPQPATENVSPSKRAYDSDRSEANSYMSEESKGGEAKKSNTNPDDTLDF